MSTDQHDPAYITPPALSRRNAVTGALAATALLAASRPASARQATPVSDDVSYLFVQACESGRATPSGNTGGDYDLTLAHVSGQTLFFSDRPDRIAGIAPTSLVLDAIEAVEDDPPNAALAFSPDDAAEVAIVELTAPSVDAEAGTITYQIRVIAVEDARESDEAAGETIAPVTELLASFGQATLFIDDMRGTVVVYLHDDNGGVDTKTYPVSEVKPVSSDIVIVKGQP